MSAETRKYPFVISAETRRPVLGVGGAVDEVAWKNSLVFDGDGLYE